MFENLVIRSSVLQPNAYADLVSCVTVANGSIGTCVLPPLWALLSCLRFLVEKHSPLENVFLGAQYATAPFFRPRNVTALVKAMLDV